MKYFIAIAVAVTALWFGSFASAETPPVSPGEQLSTVVLGTPAAGSYEINRHDDLTVRALIGAIAFTRWEEEAICAVALALAACAYLPKCYRSVGAILRYFAKLARDPWERFCFAVRREWFALRSLLRNLCAPRSAVAVNSAIGLNPRQQAIVDNILTMLGVEDEISINGPGHYAPGQVTEFDRASFLNAPLAVNAASQFAGNNPHEYLTGYAIRYTDPNQGTLDQFTDLIAPPVPSNNSRFVEYAIYGFIDAFLSLDNTVDDIRAIGADFATIRNTSKNLVTQRMNERGLAVEVDESEEILPGDTNEWQQQKIAWLLGILARTRLRRAVAMLVAMATAASKTWTAGSGADPDQDLMDELDNLPIRPTDIVYGTGSWSKRSRTFRGQATAGAFGGVRTAGLAPGVVGNALAASRDTADELAGILGVNSVRVSRHRRATGAAAIGDIIGSLVLMFISQANPSRMDNTNLKTFRAPALNPQGAPIGSRAVYVRQIGDKRWRVAVSVGSELVAATSAIGAEVVTVS